ncbi:MAG: hypothetical protein UGF89_06545 [Acutalibacteraceae bacterium]|nr:hypothetical protein [Acutalibacteraceae bacterium]
MQVIFDKVRYESDEKEVNKTYRIPNKILNVIYSGFAVSIVIVFSILLFVGSAKVDFELFRPLVFLVVGYVLINFLGLIVVSFFQKSCPANTKYGDAVINRILVSETLGYDIGKHEPYLCVVTKSLKNKEKSKDNVETIPLTDMGYYNGISEEYVVLASENKTRGLLYRPIEPHIQKLQETADNKTVPAILIVAERRKARSS